MLAKQWLENARNIMEQIEKTQMDNINNAAIVMADAIGSGHWVHTFGCGHATLPIEEMYPRIGGFVGFFVGPILLALPSALRIFDGTFGWQFLLNFIFYHDNHFGYC